MPSNIYLNKKLELKIWLNPLLKKRIILKRQTANITHQFIITHFSKDRKILVTAGKIRASNLQKNVERCIWNQTGGDIIKKNHHLHSGPRGAANERERGVWFREKKSHSVTTLLRRRVSQRKRGSIRIRVLREIHPFRFLITRRVYVKALRKTTHLALRSLAQCYAMNVSPVKKVG